ncbi:MAG: arylesterase [Pseudohongiellaceae bacterium]|nr:arylesterase [Pseudohongiellaceae bacterium]
MIHYRFAKTGSFLSLLLFLSALAIGKTHAAPETVLLVFGDSLSAAYRMPEQQGWVALMENRIAQQQLDIQVINTSVSGETTSGGLSRLPAALSAHQPDIVLLELGGNDGLRGLPIANMRQNLEKMVELIQASGAQVVLAGIQIPPNYGSRYTKPFAAQFPELAEERDLPLIPFILEGIMENPELVQDDGVHPTAEAQAFVLENVWQVLGPILMAQTSKSTG